MRFIHYTCSSQPNQDVVRDLVTPAEKLTPTSALTSSTSGINKLNTPPDFSNNQIVLLGQNVYSKCKQQSLTGTPAEAHELAHRLLLKEHSSQNPRPHDDNNSTLPQITEVIDNFQA